MVSMWWLLGSVLGSFALAIAIAGRFLHEAHAQAKRDGQAWYDLGIKHGAEKQAFADLRADMKQRTIDRVLEIAKAEKGMRN